MYLDGSNQSPELLCLVKTETLYQLNSDSFPLPHFPFLIININDVNRHLLCFYEFDYSEYSHKWNHTVFFHFVTDLFRMYYVLKFHFIVYGMCRYFLLLKYSNSLLYKL